MAERLAPLTNVFSTPALIDVSDTEWRTTTLFGRMKGPAQHSLMSAILNGGEARGERVRASVPALIDVSDTEWRPRFDRAAIEPVVPALIDVSDTEWRQDNTAFDGGANPRHQHSLMSAILNGGRSGK